MIQGPISPLLLDRYELKYQIPMSMVEPISQYVSVFCNLDYYSEISNDKFYTINSLYFDTPSYLLARKRELGGDEKSFSLRVRSYGDAPKPPYFFETKEKVYEFCRKSRGLINTERWADLFQDINSVPEFNPYANKNVMCFMDLVQTYNCSPVILTQYRRKAYISTIDDYARVTFDRSLRYEANPGYNVKPIERRMTNYDHFEYFEAPGMNCILELKCERKIPMWFLDLIKYFNLRQGRFSKFNASMIEAYGKESRDNLAYDRIYALR